MATDTGFTSWDGVKQIESRAWTCPHCGHPVASNKGWQGVSRRTGETVASVAVCHHCTLPTLLLWDGTSLPAAPYGPPVRHLPGDVSTLYDEARATANSAPTSAANACRTILMHVAVGLGAKQGLPFVKYIDYLQTEHHVPPGSTDWLDEIRQYGNHAAHEIELLTPEDAQFAVDFTAALLRNVYELPGDAAESRRRREERREATRASDAAD